MQQQVVISDSDFRKDVILHACHRTKVNDLNVNFYGRSLLMEAEGSEKGE